MLHYSSAVGHAREDNGAPLHRIPLGATVTQIITEMTILTAKRNSLMLYVLTLCGPGLERHGGPRGHSLALCPLRT